MDARQFDALTRTLRGPDSRRRLLGLLATLPLLGGLLAFLDLEEGEAKERRRRRKQRHRRRQDKSQGKRKRDKQGCKPRSTATVCAGRCGQVKSRQTCGKTVDCGACDCSPACEECFTCQGSTGTCVPQAGTPCGDATTCDAGVLQPQGICNGSGGCEPAQPVSCAPYVHCASPSACAGSCTINDDCVTGSFCESGQCVGARDNGEVCDQDGQCASGHCVESVCCDSACGDACMACDLPGSAGTCTLRPATTPCGPATFCAQDTLNPQSRCNGSGVCEAPPSISCAPYQCDGDACATSCSVDTECSSGNRCCGVACQQCCDSTQCTDAGKPYCVDGTCASSCTANDQCGSNQLCVDGTCHACNVVNGQNLKAAIEDAPHGKTLYVCPGTYDGKITISTNITLIGAGDGDGPNDSSIKDPSPVLAFPVLTIDAGTEDQPVTLRGLRIWNGTRGILINPVRHLTMLDCTVTGNFGVPFGAGIANDTGTLRMTGCTVENNGDSASSGGGGLLNEGGSSTLTDCLVRGNTALSVAGGIYNLANGTVTLHGTRVTENTAINGSKGGGISSSNGTVTLLDGSTVCANNPSADQCHNVTITNGSCGDPCPSS